jgi:hypothetical protein
MNADNYIFLRSKRPANNRSGQGDTHKIIT